MTPRTDDTQLSFEVLPHPDVRHRAEANDPTWLVGELVVPKGDLRVDRNYNAGDQFTVRVADADGQVIGAYMIEMTEPRFPPIKDKDLGVIGTTRQHICKVIDE